jgi:transcriptional regulator with XRE-family HTH domain
LNQCKSLHGWLATLCTPVRLWFARTSKPVHKALDTLAQNLKTVLAQQQRSARDVAAQAGLSNATVSNMLRGKHQASVASADSVAHALGYELWQLLCPSLPPDHAEQRRAAALLQHWMTADPRGRQMIETAAELAANKSGKTE